MSNDDFLNSPAKPQPSFHAGRLMTAFVGVGLVLCGLVPKLLPPKPNPSPLPPTETTSVIRDTPPDPNLKEFHIPIDDADEKATAAVQNFMATIGARYNEALDASDIDIFINTVEGGGIDYFNQLKQHSTFDGAQDLTKDKLRSDVVYCTGNDEPEKNCDTKLDEMFGGFDRLEENSPEYETLQTEYADRYNAALDDALASIGADIQYQQGTIDDKNVVIVTYHKDEKTPPNFEAKFSHDFQTKLEKALNEPALMKEWDARYGKCAVANLGAAEEFLRATKGRIPVLFVLSEPSKGNKAIFDGHVIYASPDATVGDISRAYKTHHAGAVPAPLPPLRERTQSLETLEH